MKHIIHFHIFKGEKKYVATGVDLAVVTEADTLDQLTKNIEEAVELYFEGEKSEDFGFVPSPSILVNFELPTPAYA